jgi:hypothetical protein
MSIEHVLNCYEQGIIPDKINILNAKDEYEKLKNNQIQYFVCGWARINEKGNIYDRRMSYNPLLNQDTVIPLYSNKEEFQSLLKKLKQA